ncbi:RICIN domain-containing protein [Microbacterium esteraromaticum]|uniref:RICIN domain-containing protein n=1 Tax=Microbacterium esteraromaticum TaxID=57043 RepID=UPI0030A0BEF5
MIIVFARRRLPIVAGLATFLVLISSGSAWSYWTAQTSAAGSVSTDTIAVSQAGFASPDVTKYLPSSLTSTRSFTVTNNSTIAGAATVTIATSETGAADLPLTVWQYTSGTCTESTDVPSGATTGTWGSTTMPLALGTDSQSKVAKLCVRTSIPDWKAITAASGGRTVNPVLSVSLNADGWVATAPTATAKQITAGMYPLDRNFFDRKLSSWFTIHDKSTGALCLDVAGSGGSGTRTISYACHKQPNQMWQFVPAGEPGLVTIQPSHAVNTNLALARDNTTGQDVQRITTGTASTAQWYVQKSDTFYQLVSKANGKCLRMSSAADNLDVFVVNCDEPQAQLAFQPVVTVPSRFRASLRFAFVATTPMKLQKKNNNGNWTDEASISSGAESVDFSLGLWETAEFRVVTANGSEVVYGGIRLQRGLFEYTPLAGAVQQ